MALKTILCNFLNLLEDNKCLKNLGKDVYELEFQKLKALTDKLKQDPEFSCKYGAQEINRCKNRYKDILPYDITRVILTEDSDVPGSDYINANYIKGASNSVEYIASQGPLPNTVVDFWRMIWECEIKIVIMACNERESGKQKCECYWPEEEKECYGNIFVEILKTQFICPDFLVRTFKAVNNNKERLIYQFHYTTWPDHGVPESVEPILQLIQLVRKFQTSEAVPILVHCSAGCGRTGTICSIDYVWRLMKMGKLTESFNLFEIISKMRKQRIAMVQTKEQYILVHRAVAALFEHQIELIDNHIYENLDESGQPLLKNSKEINICEKINKTEDTDFSESQNQYCFNDYSSKLKEVPLDKNSEEILPVMNEERFEDENQATNNINCITNENNYDQNVNFTISLPLNSAKKQSDNLSVSTTLIYNDNRIMVNLKQKETENIQNPESNNEYRITEIESSYDLRNFADSEVETNNHNENKLMKLSEDNYINLEYKNSDIEDIFLQILNDDKKQSNEKLDDKFRTNMDISSNLNQSLEKVDKNYEEIIDKSLDEMADQNSVNLFERDVLHNLTSDSVIASRQRYMCLVNECEQSFSEIERLLEEKNFENSKNILSKNNTKEGSKSDQSISNDDKVSEHEEPVCSFKVNELIQRNSTNLAVKFDEITNNNAVESLHSKNEVDDSKNNYDDTKTAEQIIDDDKLKYLEKRTDDNNRGIEELLMKNQENNEDTIEYIDSVTQDAIIANELPQNHHKINCSVSEGISNYENNNFEIDNKSLENLNYQSKLAPYKQVEKNSENFKSNFARKRTGKIFDTEDDPLNFKQERSSSFFVNNYCITDNDKHNVSSTSNSDDNKINKCAKNDFPLSETYEYENFAENSINEKSAVAQKPSIAKLKALFEKSVIHDFPKHKHKHPLVRSHSHHISQSKSGHLYSSNERTVLKPTIFNKVSKIFHTPSYEEHNEICSNKLNIHKNLKESETASISSNFCEQFLKDNESRSQWYDGAKHSHLEINPNASFNFENKLPSNKNTKNELNKRDSNAIEIGCLDISSLMSSVISDEQTVSQTQWYEENNKSSVSQYKETMHKENLSQNVSEERNSEECNEKDKMHILLDSSEENELSRLSDTNIKIPPEIPNKKKFQNISFHSYQDDNQSKKQNISDKLENTTKWYFKKENSDTENNNDHVENINNDDLNAEVNLESYDDLLTTSPQENIHNLSPNIWIKSNLDNFFNKQPPHLPPKKKCDKSSNHTNWYLKEKSSDLNNIENINDSEHVVYANMIKAKNGSLIENDNSKKQIFYKLDEEKTDLYMNVNATTRKNIEQIENSLQQHPRGAIIDLTSRQSFANEQQMNNCNEQNVRELKKTFSSDFKGKLKEYQKIILNPSKKPKGYETIWPQKFSNENNQSFVNNSDKKLSTNKNLHKHQENLEPSQKICDEYKVKPQPKPRSLVSDKHISKSNSSSALFQKHLNVKNSVSDFNRFKETSVNKVVCELNSILNVLTTRPFKSSKPETSIISSSSETSRKIHPSAPPRRKLKQDTSDCQFSNSEIYSSNHSTCNIANSNSINDVESKGQQLSKSTTLPNINYLNSKVLCQISKENNNKVLDSESARYIKDSKKLHSVYENIDTTQSNISHIEDQETSDNFKNKMHKLKHSTSDASVFSVLRNTKYKNKLTTSSAVKIENKSNDKTKQASKLNEECKMNENKSNNSCDISKQFVQTITKNEKRSADDMDIFPVAPPRSRRHGPTLKSVSEMEKFTKSLDEVGSKFPTLSVDALKSSKFSFQKKFQNNYINSNASGYSHSVSTGIGCSTDKSAKTDNLTNPISRTKSLKIIPLQKISDGSVEMKPSDKGGRSIQTDINSSNVNQYTKLSQGSICKNQES